MTAKDYPITQPYGSDPSYPLNGGFHKGVDYGCPLGTPVVVNGVQIGLSGSTGYVTGPHLHVGRWVNGTSTNPGSGGFTFDSAVVTEVGSDSTNGNFVRVQGDGASWVYLHLSRQDVKVGQELKGETMLSEDSFYEAFRGIMRREPTPDEAKNMTRDAELLVQTLWNNGGADLYYHSPAPAALNKAGVLEYLNKNLK